MTPPKPIADLMADLIAQEAIEETPGSPKWKRQIVAAERSKQQRYGEANV